MKRKLDLFFLLKTKLPPSKPILRELLGKCLPKVGQFTGAMGAGIGGIGCLIAPPIILPFVSCFFLQDTRNNLPFFNF